MVWRRSKTKTADRSEQAPEIAGRAQPVAPLQDEAPAQTAEPSGDVASFLADLAATTPRTGGGLGRLAFAMDATMSRQPTWDMALGLQADMFHAVRDVGGLDVQLIYFRGAGECRASKWVSDPADLARLMTTVTVAGGYTQIGKVLGHTLKETESRKVHALVYVGDATEEDADELCGRAGELALHGVPVFVFQEGHDPRATRVFKEIARITKGAHCHFGPGSAAELRALLSAVAVYAAGGRAALEDFSKRSRDGGGQRLLEQMR
ncbi:MAG: VWA domain-containing protein [Pseudomonadota bacterium]